MPWPRDSSLVWPHRALKTSGSRRGVPPLWAVRSIQTEVTPSSATPFGNDSSLKAGPSLPAALPLQPPGTYGAPSFYSGAPSVAAPLVRVHNQGHTPPPPSRQPSSLLVSFEPALPHPAPHAAPLAAPPPGRAHALSPLNPAAVARSARTARARGGAKGSGGGGGSGRSSGVPRSVPAFPNALVALPTLPNLLSDEEIQKWNSFNVLVSPREQNWRGGRGEGALTRGGGGEGKSGAATAVAGPRHRKLVAAQEWHSVAP